MPPSAGAPGRGDSNTERRGESVPKHRHLRKLATSWWRLAVALAVLAATFAAGTAALAGPASRDAASRPAAIGQKAAIQAALSALGVARRSDAEIVFGLARPIAAHTAVTLGGPARPAVSGLATGTRAAVTLRPTHAAWLFYDDRGPFQAYEHPGRVALVDTVTGRVTMSGTMLWPPVVGGALPPFLHSANAYAAPSGHVFYRPYRGAARLAAAADAADGVRAAFDPTQARRAGAVLAAEHACVISFGDTLGGGYYDLTRIVQSRGALAGRVAQLSRAARGVRSVTYAARGRVTPASLARSEVSAHGCREVLLYAAGSGYERGAAINIGMQLGRSTARHQDVTVAALRSLIRAERRVTFLLVLDAPSAAGFQQLVRLPNVRLVATPAGGLELHVPPRGHRRRHAAGERPELCEAAGAHLPARRRARSGDRRSLRGEPGRCAAARREIRLCLPARAGAGPRRHGRLGHPGGRRRGAGRSAPRASRRRRRHACPPTR